MQRVGSNQGQRTDSAALLFHGNEIPLSTKPLLARTNSGATALLGWPNVMKFSIRSLMYHAFVNPTFARH
jgi:hypothetical protein